MAELRPPIVRSARELAREPATENITILRIKRKRNEEPLDALLVQQQELKEKKTRTDRDLFGVGGLETLPKLFRLAETIEEASWKDASQAKQLKERITKLRERRSQSSSRPQTPEIDVNTRRDRLAEQQLKVTREARYRVVQENRMKSSLSLTEDTDDNKDIAKQLFQVYDAVKDLASESKIKTPKNKTERDLMSNFIPMVQEYLTLKEKADSQDEYVYDIYYRDDSSSTAVKAPTNVAALLWFNDPDLEFMNEYDTDSDYGDEEDEDSNAEDYYQNDYPEEDENWTDEEQESSSDEFY